MTPQEFKAWFDGYSEGIEKTPTQKQWARIKERVAEINGVTTTYPVFVDRYWRGYPTYYSTAWGLGKNDVCQNGLAVASQAVATSAQYNAASDQRLMTTSNNSDQIQIALQAFQSLGQHDAQLDS